MSCAHGPTPEPLTLGPDQLAAIATRAEAATPGPWCTDHTWDIYQGAEYVPGVSRWIGEMRRDVANEPFADAEFIAHARQDVPALLAEVDRLRARIAGLEALAADAVEYRVECPDAGLAVRRQVGGVRWAVLDGARSVLLPTGWVAPDAIHGDDGPFVWPDAVTAIAEARRALAEGGVS